MRTSNKEINLWEKTKSLIPEGTNTLSKRPNLFPEGSYPIYIDSGKGSHIFDIEGNEYIDYPMALGSISLGHAYPATIEAVANQMQKGVNFSLINPLETELAEVLSEVIPCCEMSRYFKTGSECVSAVVRLVRAYTGKNKIICCGYHGWHDWYMNIMGRERGVLKGAGDDTLSFQYNDYDGLKKVFDENSGEIAAVIMEPMSVVEPENDFLNKVKELTHKNKAVFVFDEMVTGFRYSLGGAQEYFKVTPDLGCFGKAISNGFPLAVICGKKEIMDNVWANEDFFVTSTYSGETISISAALSTIKEMKETDYFPQTLKMGKMFKNGLNELAKEEGVEVECRGFQRMHLFFNSKKLPSLDQKSLFLQETIKDGILFGNIMYISYSHSLEDIQRSLDAARRAFKILKNAQEKGSVDGFVSGKTASEPVRKV